jgi:hypothetical protein
MAKRDGAVTGKSQRASQPKPMTNKGKTAPVTGVTGVTGGVPHLGKCTILVSI